MKLNKKDIAVVIPVYKSVISRPEEMALLQAKTILQEYARILVCPNSLDVSAYQSTDAELIIMRFADHHFEGISGYNKLMICPDFYRSFLNYKFILIYQTDAWVFRDELLEWCKRGYDFIGAPWVSTPPSGKKTIFNLSKLLHGKVGNGGFCIRNVQKFYRNSLTFRPISIFFPKNEDFFWCYLMPKINPFFKIPKADVAMNFAFELDPEQCFEKTGHRLPFGCHAWEKYNPGFWSRFIPSNQQV